MAEIKKLHSHSRKRKVLVADESITIQKLVHLGLASTQFEVITAADGQDAFLKVKSMKPDLILADCNLRQLDGFDLVEKIRNDSTLLNTKTILMKGTIGSEKEARLKNSLSDEVLVKPFDARTLLQTVSKLLLDEESTLKSAASEEVTPIVKIKDNKVELLNKRLQDAAADVVSQKEDLPGIPNKIKELSSLDEDTAKVKPQNFVHSVNSEPEKTKSAPSLQDDSRRDEIFREEVLKWVKSNLPSLAEKILKEEIAKFTK